jgi:hypothetical protein
MTEIELRAWAIEHICPDAECAELLDWVINGPGEVT